MAILGRSVALRTPMKNFKLTPFWAVCLGAFLGLGLVAVIAASGLNKYTGQFWGDGSNLSNVPTSGTGTVVTNGVFQWQLDATFENTLKKEGVHGVLFEYDHIDGSGATALWRTTDSALHFPNPPVFDGFSSVLFSAGPSGGMSSVANGTGYLHDDGTGTFVWQTIALTDIQQGGATNGQLLAWNGVNWAPTTDPGSNTTINTFNITYKVAHGGTLILTNDLQLLTTNAQANTILQTDGSTNVESLANGTGYLHDNGSGTFVYQLVPLSDLTAGGTYPSANGQNITNILLTDIVDPTNGVSSASAVDFNVPDATTNVSGAFGFTSLLNFNSTNYNYAIRHVPNTSGSSQTMTVASSWKTDGLRTSSTTYTITNNTVWTFFFECQIGQFTNVHAIVSFP